jgi:hypothetical protein
MEDNLKIYKVEYISDHLSDHPQILNLISGDQYIKVEYLNNHCSDLPQIRQYNSECIQIPARISG